MHIQICCKEIKMFKTRQERRQLFRSEMDTGLMFLHPLEYSGSLRQDCDRAKFKIAAL